MTSSHALLLFTYLRQTTYSPNVLQKTGTESRGGYCNPAIGEWTQEDKGSQSFSDALGVQGQPAILHTLSQKTNIPPTLTKHEIISITCCGTRWGRAHVTPKESLLWTAGQHHRFQDFVFLIVHGDLTYNFYNNYNSRKMISTALGWWNKCLHTQFELL